MNVVTLSNNDWILARSKEFAVRARVVYYHRVIRPAIRNYSFRATPHK